MTKKVHNRYNTHVKKYSKNQRKIFKQTMSSTRTLMGTPCSPNFPELCLEIGNSPVPPSAELSSILLSDPGPASSVWIWPIFFIKLTHNTKI